MTSLNQVFHSIANEQGIEVGSKEWLLGGGAAFSGQSGGQNNYGWLFTDRLTLEYVKAVLANYGHRSLFYDDEPVRQAGYHSGGRPLGWKPSEPGDLPDGGVFYGNVIVSGPDVLHFHLGPLRAVAQSRGFKVKAKGRTIDASEVAKAMIVHYMRALAGMVRLTPTKLRTFDYGDRGSWIIMHETIQSMKTGLIDPADAKTLAEYIELAMIPFYEKPPGHSINTKANGLPVPNIQVYNGLFQLLPTFYDALLFTPSGEQAQKRLEVIVRRWSQWMVDLDDMAPSLNMNIVAFAATDIIVKGFAGRPLSGLMGELLPSEILNDHNNTAALWGFRAARVTQAVLGSTANDLVRKLDTKWLPKMADPNVKCWLADASGGYAQ